MDGGSASEQVGSRPQQELSIEDLEAQITLLAGQLNAANYRWLTLIAEYDRRQGWADGALHSCAHWLNFKCGLNLGAAREKVRSDRRQRPGWPKSIYREAPSRRPLRTVIRS